MHWSGEGGQEEDKIVEDSLRAFEAANPGVRVKRLNPGDAGSFYTKLQTMMAAGEAPDVFYVGYERVANFASLDLLRGIDEFVAREEEARKSGDTNALDLAADLRARGFRAIRRIAYRAEPATGLPPEAIRAWEDGRIGAVLFHSPRSALCAITLIRDAGLVAGAAQMEVLAISRRVADAAAAAISPAAWRALRVAERPGEDSLLRLLGRRD
jgi:hypothetical protein